jgi:hypothetical protein
MKDQLGRDMVSGQAGRDTKPTANEGGQNKGVGGKQPGRSKQLAGATSWPT